MGGPSEGPTAQALSAAFFGEFPIVGGLILIATGTLMRWLAGGKRHAEPDAAADRGHT
jgi:hypothetical protein